MPAPPSRPHLKSPLRWALWLAYIAVICYTRAHHAPWRDELDTWAMTREANFHEFITYFSYSGHPPLWYLLHLPFARLLALPVGVQAFFPVCLASLLVLLLLFESPFPLWLLAPLIFSVHLTFQYGVVARGYGLLLLLLFTVPLWHAERPAHPLRYAIVLALLFQTELFAWPAAGMLTLFFIHDCLKQRRAQAENKPPPLYLPLIPILSALVALVLLWPRADANPQHAGLHYSPEFFLNALREGFVPVASFAAMRLRCFLWCGPALSNYLPLYGIGIMVGCLMLLTAFALWRTRALLLFVVGMAGFYTIITCIYTGSFWHWGLMPLFLLFTLWFAHADNIQTGSHPPSRSLHALYVLLSIGFALSSMIGAGTLAYDIRRPYSGAAAAAEFLHSHVDNEATIVAVGCESIISVAAYFPPGRIWLDARRRYTGFHYWDYSYYACHIPFGAMVSRSLNHFAEADTLWLLSEQPLAKPEVRHLTMRYFAPGLMENFWIYEKQPAASDGIN